jgi:GABA(A) receptor-associated protein
MEDKTLDERILFSTNLKNKYPGRVPIIVEKSKRDKSEYKIENSKYLIPVDLKISEFIYIIRKKIKIDSNKAIFIFIDNMLVPMNQTIGENYNSLKNEDGFLYVTYAFENTFG